MNNMLYRTVEFSEWLVALSGDWINAALTFSHSGGSMKF